MKEFLVRATIADDHPAAALGMAQKLSEVATIKLVDIVHNSTELVESLDAKACDVVVLDFVMPNGKYGDGLTLLSFLRRRYPALKIVTVTMVENPSIIQAIMQQGVACVLSKSDALSHLIAAVHAAFADGAYLSPSISELLASGTHQSMRDLTPKEIEVVRLFTAGYTVNEIAHQLNRSKQTISSQKTAAMRKLGISRDADLVRYASDASLFVATPDSSRVRDA